MSMLSKNTTIGNKKPLLSEDYKSNGPTDYPLGVEYKNLTGDIDLNNIRTEGNYTLYNLTTATNFPSSGTWTGDSNCSHLQVFRFKDDTQVTQIIIKENSYIMHMRYSTTATSWSSWTVLSGDMSKSVYDKDNDGVIDDIALMEYYGTKDIAISPESYFTVDDTGSVTGLTDEGMTQTKIVVPYKINGMEITTLAEGAFAGNSSLTLITIPNSITSIRSGAINSCQFLTSMNIPNSVTNIGNSAFGSCISLTSITIPSSVTSIGRSAFIGCTLLESVNVPNSVTNIGDEAFDQCNAKLTIYCEQGSYADTFAQEQNIAVKYTEVGQDAILNTNIKMGYDSATLLAMYNRTDVTPSPEEWFMINEDTGAVSIKSGVFNNVDTNVYNITRIVIPWKIGNAAVRAIDTEFTNMCDYTSNITELVIPNCVHSIQYNAFYSETWGSMSRLKRINVPTSLTHIGGSAFKNCTALSDINVPVGVTITSLYESAFEGCTSLKNIDSLLRCMTSALYYGKRIFKRCSGISTIIIPENVNSLAKSMFANTHINCVTILNKNCDMTSDPFAIVQSGISDDDFDIPTFPALIKGYKGSTAETYANGRGIPFMSIEGTEVNAKADKATTLAGYGITDAYTKTEVDNKEIALKLADERLKCYGDKDVIPSDISYFIVSDDGTSITGLTDAGKTQTELVIPYNINGVEITKLGDNNTLNNVVSILDGATDKITKVVIPNSVTSIGGYAFYDCSALTDVKISDNVTILEVNAFNACTSLQNIDLPNSLKTVGVSAFACCTSLTSINIPNSVTSIGNDAFEQCSSLTSITIPNGVTSIENITFMLCDSLKSVNIPNSVTTIADMAFIASDNVTIYCEQGSYADTFAQTNNIPVIYTDVKVGLSEISIGTIHDNGKSDYSLTVHQTASEGTEYKTLNLYSSTTIDELFYENYMELDAKIANKLNKDIEIINVVDYTEAIRLRSGVIYKYVGANYNYALPTIIDGSYIDAILNYDSTNNRISIQSTTLTGLFNITSGDNIKITLNRIDSNRDLQYYSGSITSVSNDSGVMEITITDSTVANESDMTHITPILYVNITYNNNNDAITLRPNDLLIAQNIEVPITGETSLPIILKRDSINTFITVSIDDWTSNTDSNNETYYTKTITNNNLISTNNAIYNLKLSSDIATARLESLAYSCIDNIIINNGSATLYCFNSTPTTQFQLNIQIICS